MPSSVEDSDESRSGSRHFAEPVGGTAHGGGAGSRFREKVGITFPLRSLASPEKDARQETSAKSLSKPQSARARLASPEGSGTVGTPLSLSRLISEAAFAYLVIYKIHLVKRHHDLLFIEP